MVVKLHGKNYDEASEEAQRLSREEGLTMIHPFDDPDVIAGQGTIGMEILKELDYIKQQSRKNEEEDISQYETATREDLTKSQVEAVRMVEERLWIKQNPEKYEKINEDLPQFLKQRPHLAQAIAASPNRYEEAYLLMNALNPRERKVEAPKAQAKPAPGSPSSVPKGASLDQAVDVMNMTDSEFRGWRQSLRRGK